MTETVHAGFLFVDGVGAGEVGEVVIRDRQMLARDGILMVVVSVDKETGKLVSGPDIVSRGFVSQRRSTDLIEGTKDRVRDSLISSNGHHPQEWSLLDPQDQRCRGIVSLRANPPPPDDYADGDGSLTAGPEIGENRKEAKSAKNAK